MTRKRKCSVWPIASLIHRFNARGVDLGTYDHGVAGRTAIGLPPAPGTPPGAPPTFSCKPWQICGPGGPVCAPNQVWRRESKSCVPKCARSEVLLGGQCCPVNAIAVNAACSNSSCPAGQTVVAPSNFCCPNNQVYANSAGQAACCAGPLVNGQCQPSTSTPPIFSPNCPAGYVARRRRWRRASAQPVALPCYAIICCSGASRIPAPPRR